MTGRSPLVTGDEPGTCKAVTGTPYAGLDQANHWCDKSASSEIEARNPTITHPMGPHCSSFRRLRRGRGTPPSHTPWDPTAHPAGD